MATDSSIAARSVLIVASKPETTAALAQYLTGVGVPSRALSELPEAARDVLAASAIVVFPDEYDCDGVVKRVRSLRAAAPRVAMILITSAPARYRAAIDPDGVSVTPVVLAKPAFGWSILDAIRARVEKEPSSS